MACRKRRRSWPVNSEAHRSPCSVIRSWCFASARVAIIVATYLAPNSYRGGASGDYDGDGRMDLLVLPVDGPSVLLANKSESAGKWIAFQLHGTRSNRDAIGTKLTIQSCGHTQTETVRNGGSYISHNDSRIHF